MTFLKALLVGVVSVHKVWGTETARYIYVDTAMNWTNARDHCISEYGTDLAVILNGDENAEAATLTSEATWFGMYDAETNTEYFEWVDGSHYLYRNWGAGEPNNNGAHVDCVEMDAGGEWNDHSCAEERPFLCQHHHMSPNFIYVDEAKNYSEARAFCANNFGTALATILSEEEHNEAHDLMKKRNDVWIGLNALDDPLKWVWQSGKEMVYTNWYPGEPHANPERCGLIWIRWDKWNDATCYSPNNFMCDRHNRFTKKYVYESTKLSWPDARTYCNDHYGTDLGVILNEEENEELHSIIKDNTWIGAHDRRAEKMWEWVDTSLFLYTNWAPSEPNNAAVENCAEIYFNNAVATQWNDLGCEIEKSFVCSKYPQSRNYIYMDRLDDYEDATETCREEFGTTLATILSQNQNEEAWGLASNVAWIGINDASKEDGWTWQSGAAKSSYNRWHPEQPDDHRAGEDCGELFRNKYWNDAACDLTKRYLCDRSLTYHEDGNFFYVPTKMAYEDANQYCETHFGTTLAAISSGTQNDEVIHLMELDNAWIGKDDVRVEGHWEWLDGSANTYSHWAAGQPDNVNGACAQISPTGMWSDRSCDDSLAFLCNHPMDDCFCWVDDQTGDKVTCEEAPWAHYQEKRGLYWAWVNGPMPDPLPFGWRYATTDEFSDANRPNIYFFGYMEGMEVGNAVKSSSYPEVCPVPIFNPASSSCNSMNFKAGRVTNQPKVPNFETLIVHDSGLACPGFTRANGFNLYSGKNKMEMGAMAMNQDESCAPQCKKDYCVGNGNALCSAHVDDLVDPSDSADECRHVYCRDCTDSLTRCVKQCRHREDWFGDNLSCEDTCRHVGEFGRYRCFNNFS